MVNKTLLIDGDLLLYRAASACETEVQWDEDVWLLHGNVQEAKHLFTTALDGITNALGSHDIIMCLSDRENFRKKLTDTYKSKRKTTRKPVVFKPLMDWVTTEFDAIIKPQLEADDVLGILATHPDYKDRVIVVSEDKDLQTLPCTLYRQGELKTISPVEADYFWMFQTLTGDATDGYSGCPGIGPKKAEVILRSFQWASGLSVWHHVVAAFRKEGLTEDDALLQARLARILRFDNWDIEKQEVKLWSPSTTQASAPSLNESAVEAQSAA